MGFNWLQSLAIVIGSAIAFYGNSSNAQIAPDGTLPNNTKIERIDKTFNITGGSKTGGNLFHSFKEFSVPDGSTAFFDNGTDIQNIINRVTGGSISNIDGLIKANGSANLFLINPKGIIFGENARLDIGGSFIGSTAEIIKFADDFEFSAINPEAQPLLTINIPLGLQYGSNPGKIEVKGKGDLERGIPEVFVPKSGLRVPDSQTLALLGGDILLEGATLKAAAGRVELGSVKGAGQVNISPLEKGFTFGFDNLNNFGDIRLSNITAVDTSGNGAGDVRVTGKNIIMTDNSVITSTQTGTQKSGNIFINAAESVNLNGTNDIGVNNTFIPTGFYANNVSGNATEQTANIEIKTPFLKILDGATVTTNVFGAGKGGNINIEASTLAMERGGKVSANTFSSGSGGDLNVESQNIEILGTNNDDIIPSFLSVAVEKGATGNGGDLKITTNNLLVGGGSFLAANTSGEGDGGNMIINAASQIELLGRGGGIFTVGEQPSTGDSGSLTINTKLMRLENSVFVSVSNNSLGNAGELKITTNDLFIQDNARVITGRVNEDKSVGDLTIKTNNLLVDGGSSIKAGTSSNSGSFNIEAEDIQVIGTGNNGNTPSQLTLSTRRNPTGNGGDLNIKTKIILIKDGAFISTGTSGESNGGNLNIDAEDVQIIGQGGNNPGNNNLPYASGLFASAEKPATGNAGKLTINTQRMIVEGGAFVSNSTDSPGNGEDLTINTKSLRVANGSFINSGTSTEGRGGDLQITTDTLLIEGGAEVSSDNSGKGDGGNVTVNALDIQLIGTGNNGNTPSSLSAATSSNSIGNAGKVSIVAQRMLVEGGAFVATSTKGKGNGGELKIDAQELEVIGVGGNNPGNDNLPYLSGLFSSADRESTAEKAGDLTINSQRMVVKDGARVGAGTFSNATAGKLTINTNSLEVQNGSSIVSEILGGGKGEKLTVNAETLKIENNSRISVASEGQAKAGNIEVNSSEIVLDNRGEFRADSASGNGGNINLQVSDLLLLRRNSKIVTDAGTQQFGGDGGNIDINSKFIVALPQEDSDITANAFSGFGGRVDIETNGIFGIFPQDNPTQFSDITASSELGVSGEVNIDRPDIDPSTGLIELPQNLVDVSQQIARSCTPEGNQNNSSFISTGRGGLPQSPNQPLQNTAVITNWIDLPPQTRDRERTTNKLSQTPVTKIEPKIVEAQKIVVDKNGDTFLVAESPQSFSYSSNYSCG